MIRLWVHRDAIPSNGIPKAMQRWMKVGKEIWMAIHDGHKETGWKWWEHRMWKLIAIGEVWIRTVDQWISGKSCGAWDVVDWAAVIAGFWVDAYPLKSNCKEVPGCESVDSMIEDLSLEMVPLLSESIFLLHFNLLDVVLLINCGDKILSIWNTE